MTPECAGLREPAYGRRPRAYRIIYAIDEQDQIVSILHIRHGARDRITPSDLQ
jgi:mRNA-degrading endonuclease RelE of RelBE toxin-antitoxin system